uniref:Abasic site processing protein n=1 Tax=Cyanothece sp. (strain PCC 7425 / ATCC 29141) TaxID=395961 RepID=B8HTB0_CYAP4
MCGRFCLAVSPEELAEVFGLSPVSDFPPRYNIAPTQPVAVIRQIRAQAGSLPEGKADRQLDLMHWGLIPSWAKDPSLGNRLINARAETLSEKPSFRTAFQRRRCLIPASGFYEWQKTPAGKQPYYLHPITPQDSLKPRSLFAFAGLWETWQDILSCTIITTVANDRVRPIHDRMPVILKPEDYDRWLDPTEQDTSALQDLLTPLPEELIQAYPVSKRVNQATVDQPDCIQPVN